MKKEEAKEELAVNGDVKEEVKGAEAAAVEAGDEPKVHASAKGCNSSPDDDKVAPTMKEEQEHAPNSTPRMMDPDEDTYVYRDFSAVPPPTMSEVGSLHPQSLQAQKLPAKLASMLADHELTSVIVWSPHGRSWRVLNRDMFAEHALPRYFGHKNYASFVRIVNAWGFRRITRGPDRDCYYHELFLRGRPDLHMRMKRLSTCHRKTPVHKEDKCPDFYELSKTNPLPDVFIQGGRISMGGMMPNMGLRPVNVPGQFSQFSRLGMPPLGTVGPLGAPMGNINEQVLTLLTNDAAARSMNAGVLTSIASAAGNSGGQPSLPRLAQLQRDNEELRRRIMEMENMQAQQGGMALGGHQASSNMTGAGNSTATGGGGNEMLGRELERMQRDFMMRSNTPMNNSLNNSYPSFGAHGNPGGMSTYSRDEMILHAMRMENQMGYHQQSAQGGSSTSAAGDDKRKAMIDMFAKQQQQQQQEEEE
ncbi:hypothetical protein ACHAXA_002390, partial [Cyclostephanos tholiformis]